MLLIAVIATAADLSRAETVARCGAGWLERIDGYPVPHLKGTPYEMGYQHGVLFKDHVRENAKYLLEVKGEQETLECGNEIPAAAGCDSPPAKQTGTRHRPPELQALPASGGYQPLVLSQIDRSPVPPAAKKKTNSVCWARPASSWPESPREAPGRRPLNVPLKGRCQVATTPSIIR